MSEKKSSKLFAKLKNVKHIEIYIAIIFFVIIMLIYISSGKTKETSKAVSTDNMTVAAYIESMEKSLEESLSNIAGISDVKVMITLNFDGFEVIDSKINLTTFPEIKGILVTAKGVNNTTNKMKVLHAVESVIDIKGGNIQILSSE